MIKEPFTARSWQAVLLLSRVPRATLGAGKTKKLREGLATVPRDGPFQKKHP